MGDISIKVNIADRIYPLKVATEEEELVRKAVKNINERIRLFQQDYTVKDKQDLLSMAVLHYAMAAMKWDQKDLIEDIGISEKINHIDQMIAGFMGRQ